MSAADWSDVCELAQADRTRTASSTCMSCHDGTTATATSFSTRAAGIGTSHPVTVDYGAIEARYPGRYEPRGALPAAVPLVDGKVECTSCHDGRSSAPHRVAEHPQLCMACHRL